MIALFFLELLKTVSTVGKNDPLPVQIGLKVGRYGREERYLIRAGKLKG